MFLVVMPIESVMLCWSKNTHNCIPCLTSNAPFLRIQTKLADADFSQVKRLHFTVGNAHFASLARQSQRVGKLVEEVLVEAGRCLPHKPFLGAKCVVSVGEAVSHHVLSSSRLHS